VSFRRLVLAIMGAAGLAAAYVAVARRAASAASPLPTDVTAPSKSAYVGPLSCAAAGCHNGNDLNHPVGSEYSIWSGRDPHARAFAILGEERSQNIMKALHGGDARQTPTCLGCHSLPPLEGAPPPESLLADGVSCEACHGPAGGWGDIHYTAAWRELSSDEKEQHGFFPTRNLVRRIDRCSDCHVGRPGAEVNHDLIAAGHPRLAFEYTAYHELLPRHWNETTYGPDFPARAWEIGQATTARKAAELMASHKPAGVEFADLDCFVCHHDLGRTDWRQRRPGGTRGLPLPATWYTAELTVLKEGSLDPAVKASDDLREWAIRLQDAAENAGRKRENVTPERLRALLLRVAKQDSEGEGPPDWDHAVQTYLAIAALDQALEAVDRETSPLPRESVQNLRDALKFPAANGVEFDSPRDFTPARFRDALKKVRDALGG
jgi:hypothetical protein